jgi:signal transduction histidine kinase
MSRTTARTIFAVAVILLVFSALAGSIMMVRLVHSADRVARSYDVQVALAEIDATVSAAGRARLAYVDSGEPEYLHSYETSAARVPEELRLLRQLTRDNPAQQILCGELEEHVNRWLFGLKTSVEARKSPTHDGNPQISFNRQIAEAGNDAVDVIGRMQDAEASLLGERRHIYDSVFTIIVTILAAAFALSVALLWLHFRLLRRELLERTRAEKEALESQEASRRLSTRLMEFQDEERRKFARELHDSLGQYLAVIKMNLETLARRQPESPLINDSLGYLEKSISETRTISHLLHPPLLDEVGFVSAAEWFIDGFAQRSGIQVASDIPKDLARLPRAMELALFRVLQEALTNIHRHSGSMTGKVSLEAIPEGIVLKIEDHGKGIPKEVLAGFQTNGRRLGVGLAGMRERIREQGGRLEVRSAASGTLITVALPLPASPEKLAKAAGSVESH